jgi:hypothetical protein
MASAVWAKAISTQSITAAAGSVSKKDLLTVDDEHYLSRIDTTKKEKEFRDIVVTTNFVDSQR